MGMPAASFGADGDDVHPCYEGNDAFIRIRASLVAAGNAKETGTHDDLHDFATEKCRRETASVSASYGRYVAA